MPTRIARTQWSGGLNDGSGQVELVSSGVGTYDVSFPRRSADTAGGVTSPEELIAAAHASCFAMALSAQLEAAGLPPENVDSRATVTLDKVEGGFAVTSSHLEVTVKLANPDQQKFEAAAQAAKTGCPISKLIAAAKITLDARLA